MDQVIMFKVPLFQHDAGHLAVLKDYGYATKEYIICGEGCGFFNEEKYHDKYEVLGPLADIKVGDVVVVGDCRPHTQAEELFGRMGYVVGVFQDAVHPYAVVDFYDTFGWNEGSGINTQQQSIPLTALDVIDHNPDQLKPATKNVLDQALDLFNGSSVLIGYDVSGSVIVTKLIEQVKSFQEKLRGYSHVLFSTEVHGRGDGGWALSELKKFKYGGGTNVECVLQEAKTRQIENVLLFSDGEFEIPPGYSGIKLVVITPDNKLRDEFRAQKVAYLPGEDPCGSDFIPRPYRHVQEKQYSLEMGLDLGQGSKLSLYSTCPTCGEHKLIGDMEFIETAVRKFMRK